MSDQSIGLRAKLVTSAKLSTLEFASNIGVRLVSTVVLTRLLAPEIYGIFAIVLLYLYILEMFSDLGIRSLILTKEGEVEDDFLRTCWTVSILRGCVVALFSCVIAGVIAAMQGMSFFATDSPYTAPVLPWALAALGATMIITSLQSPMVFMQERQMSFNRVTALNIIVNLVTLVITISLAFFLKSVWALVLGNIARSILRVTLSFVMFDGPRMYPVLNQEHLRIVLDRGKWIIGHSILTALAKAGDRLVLGFVMSSSTFGFYFIARQLVDIVLSFLMSVNSRVGLQVFTQLHKSDVADFRRNYYRYRLVFDALAGLSTGGLVVLSPVIVQILFDERYQEVAPIAQTLIWGVLLVGPLLLRSAFSAERRFKHMTFLSLISTGTLWIGLLISVFVLESTEAAITVIALHRMPEAMIFIMMGGDRDWVIIWREFLGFAYCAIGIILGLGVLEVWNLLT